MPQITKALPSFSGSATRERVSSIVTQFAPRDGRATTKRDGETEWRPLRNAPPILGKPSPSLERKLEGCAKERDEAQAQRTATSEMQWHKPA